MRAWFKIQIQESKKPLNEMTLRGFSGLDTFYGFQILTALINIKLVRATLELLTAVSDTTFSQIVWR